MFLCRMRSMHSYGYIELHCHSGYSFLDGASHPEELVLHARELGMPALALTDHDGLYGSMEFARSARIHGLQPITGVELTVDRIFSDVPQAMHGNPSCDEVADGAVDDRAGVMHSKRWPESGHHVTLLAETPTGYANLCRLITRARMERPREAPALAFDVLLDPQATQGLILLTGCRRSPVLAALRRSHADAEAMLSKLIKTFGPDRIFVELQYNEVRGDANRIRALCRLADAHHMPVVATGNVHYHRSSRYPLQDVLVAIRTRSSLDGCHEIRRPNRCWTLASAELMAHRFAGRPDALTNTLRIAERCAAFDLTRDLGYTFPDFEGSQRADALTTLRDVCRAELTRRYEPGSRHARAAEERLQQELALVDQHGLAGFFLVYRDIMQMARDVALEVRADAPRARSGLPPGRGRGSSVSSIICYLIGLSHVDPVQADLFLGRFLNEALRSVPDIDLDFPRDIRERLILRVYEHYGREHAGLVCTFPTFRLRSAVREIGHALELPTAELEQLARLAESRSASGLKNELERLPEFRDKAQAPMWRALGALAEQIAGLPRHVSQHVGGMVISSRPLVELVPLEPAAMEGRVLCQWDKDSCEDAGFIKIDFLALGMLSLVEDAVDLISERQGTPPDLARIDYADTEVYDRICAGDTVGLFQIESRAQIQMLRRVQPRTLEDLAVQIAIVRPGPIVGGAVNPYVRRRELLREDPHFDVPYDHPLLEEALGETLGVIIYQDQVLKVCRALAGFSDGQAEELRRAMSRKRSAEAMQAHQQAFLEGAARRGVCETVARTVFDQVQAFSAFGFPKSHSTAFAVLAYQSAWLRHYHPLEYYVALFNNQPMGFYSLDALGRDARRNGIELRLPCIQRSDVLCRGDEGALRLGLGFVRGIGVSMAERLVAERERRGPFRSPVDLLRRTPATLKRPALENLVWVGALDRFGLSRRELLWQIGLWLGPESDARRTGGRDDHPQFELDLESTEAAPAFDTIGEGDRIVAEYGMLGLSTAAHPLTLVREHLPDGTISSAEFATCPNRSTVRVAGLVTARQRPSTAKGHVFVLMEDEAGAINVIVRPDIYERDRSIIRLEPFLSVTGRLQKDGATMNVIAHRIDALRAPRTPAAEAAPEPDALHATRRPDLDQAFKFLSALRQQPPGVKSWG